LTNQIRLAARLILQAASKESCGESRSIDGIRIGCREAVSFVSLPSAVDDKDAYKEEESGDGSGSNPLTSPQYSPSKHHDESNRVRAKGIIVLRYSIRNG